MAFEMPLVVGHRGAAGHAPENTFASIRKAAELGASWIEVDVMLTGDDRPVLFHDENLKRLTGVDAMMAETPLGRVSELDAGGSFAPGFAGERIPTLEEAMDLCRSLGLGVNLEIKSTAGRDVETAQVALAALEAWRGRRDDPPVLVSSFSRMSLAVARACFPDWPRGLIVERVPTDWRDSLVALGCVTFHLRGQWLRRSTIRAIKSAGYGVAAFTVNRPAHARALVARGVDSIITDWPDRIRSALR